MQLWCNRCKQMLDVSWFTLKNNTGRGYQYACITCRAKQDGKRDWSGGTKKKKTEESTDATASKRPQGRPPGARDKKPRPPRNVPPRKTKRQQLIEDAGSKITEGAAVSETPKQLLFILRAVMDQQLRLFYLASVTDPIHRTRVESFLADANFEIRAAVTRFNHRTQDYLRQATPPSPLEKHGAEKIAACKIMGLSEDASPTEIKEAYRQQARKVHPDVGGNTAEMQTLNQAFHSLLED